MKKVLTFSSYILVIVKIILLFLAIFYIEGLVDFDILIGSPLLSVLCFLLGFAWGLGISRFISLALAAALIISWILIFIMLFIGLRSKKARKVLSALSVFPAIIDSILYLAAICNANDGFPFKPVCVWGLLLALCTITVNVACLRNDS